MQCSMFSYEKYNQDFHFLDSNHEEGGESDIPFPSWKHCEHQGYSPWKQYGRLMATGFACVNLVLWQRQEYSPEYIIPAEQCTVFLVKNKWCNNFRLNN